MSKSKSHDQDTIRALIDALCDLDTQDAKLAKTKDAGNA